jgi:putative GTP pyrophosphokinase
VTALPHESETEATSPVPDLEVLGRLTPARADLVRFFLEYKFGIEEVQTKVGILQQEFTALHEYSPIEHVSSRLKSSRLKSPRSILDKTERKGIEPSLGAVRSAITDIAGLRITCSFASDVYRMAESLGRQPDLTVLRVKDYIARPKPNGYRSLHLLVSIPVFIGQHPGVPVDGGRRGAGGDPTAHGRHGLLGQPRAQDPLQVPGRRPR